MQFTQQVTAKQHNSCKIKDKIFNIRKVLKNQPLQKKKILRKYPIEKFQSPMLNSSNLHQKYNAEVKRKIEVTNNDLNSKINEYNLQELIISSQTYKELNQKYNQLKYEQSNERKILMDSIKQKYQLLKKGNLEKERIQKQKQRLRGLVVGLKQKLNQLRNRNQQIRLNIQERENFMRTEYFRNLLLSMRYQNELLQYDINPDNMTYQELLQLEEKIGNVSKGLTEEQLKKIPKYPYEGQKKDQLCPICYYQIKLGEIVNKFNCGHIFHHECIQTWLQKQKICPMCKQQIIQVKSTEQN